MVTFIECIPCLVRQALDSVLMTTADAAQRERVLREALRLLSGMDLRGPPPAGAQKLHRLVRGLTGKEDPYREVKTRFNRWAAAMYPRLRCMADEAPEPFEAAVRLAIAGNIIDLGAKSGRVAPARVGRKDLAPRDHRL
ncbi:MAG: hypothetical protein A3K19_14590 [Lentisphaerae bacterium RIFOXYB12_FULL_65_16]|nr:MAG: hypothetical protein A3K18_18635 [Lentisphaerae bacterium RIFOXYA12_64_32]OGV87450.1 MAG: hypothetical protein A3K19_14590 [Lentisphaerae bacterium RIFOXYB12_FULL_65_16]